MRTMLGRVRHLPDLTSRDISKRSQAERQAVNSIIQGSASDIIKFAMLATERAIDRWMTGRGVEGQAEARPRLVMQIHDELVYDVCNNSSEAVSRDSDDALSLSASCRMFVHLLKQCMEGEVMRALRVSVPLITTVSIGRSWGHLQPFNTGTQFPDVSASASTGDSILITHDGLEKATMATALEHSLIFKEQESMYQGIISESGSQLVGKCQDITTEVVSVSSSQASKMTLHIGPIDSQAMGKRSID